ncbi:MAG TPA: hypothetical protein GXX40_06735 [Firmicutes bacterium]|nr:hypothetical protein [Bacillota bacterium]
MFKYLNQQEHCGQGTKGQVYEDLDDYFTVLPQEQANEGVSQDFNSGSGWDKNVLGEWLLSGRVRRDIYRIYLLPPGSNRLREIMKGELPVWRPMLDK